MQGTTAQIIEKVPAPQHSTLPDDIRLIMVEHSNFVLDDIVIFSTQESNSGVGLHSGICGTDITNGQLIIGVTSRIRLHHTLKENRQFLADSGDRKNGKTLKFSHELLQMLGCPSGRIVVAKLLFKVVFTVSCYYVLSGIDEITNCTCVVVLQVHE